MVPLAERRQKIFAAGRSLVVRACSSEEIIDLRHRVLRQGLPREAAIFAGDRESGSIHFAAFATRDGDESAVCCATFHVEPYQQEPAWRLRGMATDAEFRGQGVGRAVLSFAQEQLLERAPGRRLLWCNARLAAVPFYEAQGWQVVSELFDIPTAGPHHVMVKRL